MAQDLGKPISSLKVDGGASTNNFLLQFQSDISRCRVFRPKCVETTALGAAYLAGLAVGYWQSRDDIRANWAVDRSFDPRMPEVLVKEKLHGWHKAVKCALLWAED